MEAIENLLTRRSIRQYKTDMIPKDTLDKIVEAGAYAANGRGKQAVITIAVTNKELRDKLSEDNRKIGGWEEGFDPFYGAPVVLIVLAEKDCPTAVYDGSCVMENLMLAAHNFGVGSCWIHRAKEEFEIPVWKEWLKSIGVNGEYTGIGHCVLGFADGDVPQAAPRNENRIFYVE